MGMGQGDSLEVPMPTRERRLAELAKEQTQLGADVALVPLYVSPAVVEALVALRAALIENHRFSHDCELWFQRLQRRKDGPLTDVLAALVGDA